MSCFLRGKLRSSDSYCLSWKRGHSWMTFALAVALFLLVSVVLFRDSKLDTGFRGVEREFVKLHRFLFLALKRDPRVLIPWRE